MYGPSYVQKQLAPFAPPEASSTTQKVRFDITLGAKDGAVVLEFEQAGCPGQDFITITEDCFVEIVLHGDQIFFSKDLDGITTKTELASFYGGLTYDQYDRKTGRYRMVSFHARYNNGGQAGTIHGFNVNVDLFRGFDDQRQPKWTALTIDPDIKNPPPIPS